MVVPLMTFMLGGVYTIWTALHSDIGLTNAARAGALEAVRDINSNLTLPHTLAPGTLCTALKDARAGVAAEENIAPVTKVKIADPAILCGGVFPTTCTAVGGNPCISITYIPHTLPAPSTQVYYLLTVKVEQQVAPQIPIASGVHVKVQATEASQ